jgi:ubiquinone/menaquinone biosynthesis C-methylase UbiE
MVHKARQNLGRSQHHFVYRVLDAQELPFPDESFEGIVANHMLYHLPDRERVLREIHRVLRVGGHLYAATNGHSHLLELRELVTRFYPDVDAPDVAAEFGLENGAAQLLSYFPQVTRHRQQNALVVTETEPLIAYVQSMVCRNAVPQEVATLTRAVHEQITSQGAIHIQKDSGLFVARKA